MSEKIFNSRIVHKHDIEAHWNLAVNFVPKQGEIIVYDVDDTYTYERFKIGDGVSNVNDLPFITDTVDYNKLLNRPFGESAIVILPKTTIECTAATYRYVDGAKTVVIGEMYTIIFDGVEYQCECLSPKGFGNEYIADNTTEDTGEPFFLRYDGMVDGYVLFVEEVGVHTIAMEQPTVEYIDEKYIPHTIARVTDMPSIDGLASESYVDDKITELVGDTPVAEQIAVSESNMAEIYAPIDSPVFTSNISFGRKADSTVGYQSVALGSNVEASGYLANATGSGTIASGPMSHAEGASSKSTSDSSHAEGGGTTASGSASHAEGRSTIASGSMAHSEGYMTTASGEMSHAEGNNTRSEGSFSHAEGLYTVTRSDSSHVQGQYNIIEPYISNVETIVGTIEADSNGLWIFDSYTFDSSTGKYTPDSTTKYTSLPNNTTQYFAVKPSYVTETTCTEMFKFTDIASYSSSSVSGTYEHYVSALEHDYAHVVGNGENDNNRSNAHTVDWNGLGWFAGGVKVGGIGQDDANAKELATTEYIDGQVATVNEAIGDISALIGDKEVGVQIDEAIASKADLEHTHDLATTTTMGFMASPDKAFIEKLKVHELGVMSGKTISDLQAALSGWLQSACTIPNAVASFALDGGFISLWNNGDTTTTLTSGSRWTVELKTYASSGSYAKLELTSYGYNNVYYINYSNGVWGDIRSIAFSDEVPSMLEFNNLSSLVGDTSVSEQIDASQIVYVGPTQPTDPNIKVWINTAEEGTGVVPVLPRVATITLAAAGWTGSATPYSQVVSINTVTSATKIELNPTVTQIISLQNDDIALMAENDGGTVTVYSFGGKPSADMTMQATLTEVSYV